MTKLSVNLNKVATLRNTRTIGIPSVVHAARLVLDAGAHGITVHPRPDQRHIRPHDVHNLAELLRSYPQAEFNIEGNPFHQYLDFARGGSPSLTTRANMPGLIAASKEIFDRLESEPPDPRLRPTPHNRLLFISRFFHAPLVKRRRRWVGALALVAVAGVLAFGAVKSVRRYHPIYMDRMQKLQSEAVNARSEER